MPSTLGTVAELSYIHSINAVLSLTVQEFLLLGQTGWSNTVNQSVRHGFSLIERIQLARVLGVGELANIAASEGELSLSVRLFFCRSEAGVSDMLEELICCGLACVKVFTAPTYQVPACGCRTDRLLSTWR